MLRAMACYFAAPASPVAAADERVAIDALTAQHASASAMPVAFVRHVIRLRRESNFNPHLVDHGNYGLMQIRLGRAARSATGHGGRACSILRST